MLDLEAVVMFGGTLKIIAAPYGVDVAISADLDVEDRVTVIMTRGSQKRTMEAGPGAGEPEHFMLHFLRMCSELQIHGERSADRSLN